MKPHPVVLVYCAERPSLRMRIIPTDTRMKQKTGAAIQNRAVPLQACGPHEPHPRQVDILLDNGMLAL